MNQSLPSRTCVWPTLLATSVGCVKPSCEYRRIPSAKKRARQPSPTGHTGSLQVLHAMRELPNRTSTGMACQTHLVVMANGLFGKSSNWDVIIEELQQTNLNLSHTLLVASNANSLTQVWTVFSTTAPVVQLDHLFNHCCFLQTYDGIDTCGDRLASEIKNKVKEYPSLQNISLLGHSMGGLLVRYAAGGY